MDTRLIVDEPACGSWNMAVDEALLQSVGQGGAAVLRFYQWQPATLSLGYFQKFVDRAQHPASSTLDIVRRATGGGAIVHDNELTYSFVAPLGDRFSPEAQSLVKQFHESLVTVLSTFGIASGLCGPAPKSPSPESFLCFQRRNALDVLIDNQKVVGSAQRTRHRVLLQHGSILLGRSTFAQELPGIADVSNVNMNTADSWLRELTDRWSSQLSHVLGIRLVASTLTKEEFATASNVENERFASPKWTEKR